MSAPLVTIIVPAFNQKRYIGSCLDSLVGQSYKNLEILIVDDGSEDETLDLCQRASLGDKRIVVRSVPNGGQGLARNIALGFAKGKYVMFVDSDDTIERTAVETLVSRAEKDSSDFVRFSLKYFRTGKGYSFRQSEPFFGKKILVGSERFSLLDTRAYYSVIQMYRTDFLRTNKIRFAEGRIYEDNILVLKAVLSAERVSVVYSPLYNVRVHSASTTRTNLDTDKHYRDYIALVKECVSLILSFKGEGAEKARYYYARYAVRKFMEYYYRRIPKCYRKDFAREFVEQIALLGDFDVLRENDKLLRFCSENKVFLDSKVTLFRFLTYYMKRIRPKKSKLLRSLKSQGLFGKMLNSEKSTKAEVDRHVVLFMGFDHRYSGNSRYLFDLFVVKHPELMVYYATDSDLVDERHRVSPASADFHAIFDIARVVIFESWVPSRYRKRPGTVWIQLWHGNPIKKMLFDSEEHEIFAKNPKTKIRHYADIKRWDYFVVESDFFAEKFERAFLVPRSRFLFSRYPRVDFLMEHKEDFDLKCDLRKKFNIAPNKKLVLYLPTWRDYNYGLDEEDYDLSYELDCERLSKALGDEYEVVRKGHSYLYKDDLRATSLPPEAETQELLLIADVVISDYSSVIFDAASIGIPFLLFCPDLEKFENSRGLYEDIWEKMDSCVCCTFDELVSRFASGLPSCQGAEEVRKLSSDGLTGSGILERTITRFTETPFRPARSLLVASDSRELRKGLLALQKTFKDYASKNPIVACLGFGEEAAEVEDVAKLLGIPCRSCNSLSDLDAFCELFWVDRVVLCDGSQRFEAMSMTLDSDCYYASNECSLELLA